MKLNAVILSSAALLTFAGCNAPTNDQDQTSNAIIGGTTDNGDPSVVALFALSNPSTGEGSLCTASVISPTVLLTAAHCVAPSEVGSGVTFTAILGTDWSAASDTTLKVSATHYDTAFDANNLENGHDVGVAILESPTTLTPLPYATTSEASLSGSVRLVGYGVSNGTAQTGAGTKRTVTAPIDGVSAKLLQIGDSKHDTCQGDSGGPAFAKVNGVDTIVGTTSYGASGCTGGGYDTRVDLYTSFIQKYTGASSTGGGSTGGGSTGGGSTGGGSTGGGGGTTAGSEAEPNDSHATANTIVNGAIDGSLATKGDADWFEFDIPDAATYVVDLGAARTSTKLNVYKLSSSGSVSSVGTQTISSSDGDRVISKKSLSGGTYFVKVTDDGKAHTDSGAYTVTVQLQ